MMLHLYLFRMDFFFKRTKSHLDLNMKITVGHQLDYLGQAAKPMVIPASWLFLHSNG